MVTGQVLSLFTSESNIKHDFCGLTKQVNSTSRDPDNLREERPRVLFFKCILSTKHPNHLGQIPRTSPDLMNVGEGAEDLPILQAMSSE